MKSKGEMIKKKFLILNSSNKTPFQKFKEGNNFFIFDIRLHSSNIFAFLSNMYFNKKKISFSFDQIALKN